MTVILQISDTHFGTERPPVVEALLRCVREQAPDVVVLSGDITQRARRAQFRAARAFLDRLGVRVTLVIPGNHDIPLYDAWARLVSPYANHCREFGTDLEPEFESAELLVITVNTTRWYRHIDGEVSAVQVARVAERLARATPAQLRLVVTHQPVAVVRPQDEVDLLHGGMAALRRWSRAGVDLILGGHIHLPYVVGLHELIADLPRKAWAVQAGTALSWRIRCEANNSINIIRRVAVQAPGRRAMVERWDYVENRSCFERVATHDLCFADASGAS